MCVCVCVQLLSCHRQLDELSVRVQGCGGGGFGADRHEVRGRENTEEFSPHFVCTVVVFLQSFDAYFMLSSLI